jgi:predicted O-methyltransferase YrrM
MTAEELIQHCSQIPSSVFEPEQEMWWRRLKDLPGIPVIVDFGTGHGKSAASLALACPQGVVYTFDPGLPYINAAATPEQYEQETRDFIKNAGANNVTFTRESSLERLWDKEIDVLNIDSDHTYETTKAEILRWLPFVKVGGLVFFHDYDHPRCPGVRQAIDEFIPSTFNMELLEVTDAGQVKCACFKKL